MGSFKRVLVLGAGGFIGSHLVRRLKEESCWVRGADRVRPSFAPSTADDFVLADLRDPIAVNRILTDYYDEIYQLAAEMGGAGFIFSGRNDFEIFLSSAKINLNVIDALSRNVASRVFFSSSACVYNHLLQTSAGQFHCREDDAYPAYPDSEYGWEKLFSERLFSLLSRKRSVEVRIARLHNVYGPCGAWNGGREKAPAAICRKVAEARDGGEIQVWGDGTQLRSFLYIDDCIDGIVRLMRSGVQGPLNIGSEEIVSINELVKKVISLSGKALTINYVAGPIGVGARCSDNRLVSEAINWSPTTPLESGLNITYSWIAQQVAKYLSGSAE